MRRRLLLGKSSWEVVAGGGPVYRNFRGTPVRLECSGVCWMRKRELIPAAENFWVDRESGPRMLVKHFGCIEPTREPGTGNPIKTGLGGEIVERYSAPGLIFCVHSGPSASDLGVSMCSPGGWIGSRSVATELRTLKGTPHRQAI